MLDHVVFAEPNHAAAKALLADTLEQLGFGAENGTWRSAYLAGAHELRSGNFGTPTATASADVLAALPPALLLDAIAIQIDGPKAWDLNIATRWHFPDTAQTFRVTLRNGVLVSVPDGKGEVTLTVTVPRASIAGLASGDVATAITAGLALDGDASVLQSVLGVLDPGDPSFNIMTP